jgi:hypothetical protein
MNLSIQPPWEGVHNTGSVVHAITRTPVVAEYCQSHIPTRPWGHLHVDLALIASRDGEAADPAIEVAKDVVEIVAVLVGGDGGVVALELGRREDSSAAAVATWDRSLEELSNVRLAPKYRNTYSWQSVGHEAQESDDSGEEKHLLG